MLFKEPQTAAQTEQLVPQTQTVTMTEQLVPQTGGTELATPEQIASLFSVDDNMTGTEPRLPSAKILSQGAMFETPDGEIAKTLTGVIVDSNKVNAYWEHSFDETGGGIPPDCFSHDGMTPNLDASISPSCITCPMNKFGSDGSRGKACKNMRRVHLLMGDDRIPTRVTLPPTSLRAFDEYMTWLYNKNISYPTVVTKIELIKQKNKDGIEYAEAKFSMVEPIKTMDRLMQIAKIKKMMLVQMQREEIVADEYAQAPSDSDQAAGTGAEHF